MRIIKVICNWINVPFQTWLNRVAFVVLICFGAFLLQLYVWWVFPVNVIDYYDMPAKVLNQDHKVKRGEFLEFEITYQKFFDFPAKISRALVNDRIVTLTCEAGTMQITGHKAKTKVRTFIPFNVFPGKYKLVTDVRYQVNPLNEDHERYETEWFEVTE